jgi:hypothetical protein
MQIICSSTIRTSGNRRFEPTVFGLSKHKCPKKEFLNSGMEPADTAATT